MSPSRRAAHPAARLTGPRLLLLAFSAAASLTLSACGQSLATTMAEATAVYGIAKGVAIQAEMSNPSLTPTIAAIEAKADPLAAAVSADTAPTLASLSNDLLTATAQAVTVLPNNPPAPAAK